MSFSFEESFVNASLASQLIKASCKKNNSCKHQLQYEGLHISTDLELRRIHKN